MQMTRSIHFKAVRVFSCVLYSVKLFCKNEESVIKCYLFNMDFFHSLTLQQETGCKNYELLIVILFSFFPLLVTLIYLFYTFLYLQYVMFVCML